MAQIAPIQPIAPSLGVEVHDDVTAQPPQSLQRSAGAVGNDVRQREAEVARRGEQADAGGSWGGPQSIDDNLLRHVMHGLTSAQRHLVYRRAFAMRRGVRGSNGEDGADELGADGEASFIDFLALNVALRSMRDGRDAPARDQTSIEELLARRDALWETSRSSILQWIPASEGASAHRGGELSDVKGNEHGWGPIASSASALDFLRRLVLPQRGKASDEWIRRALTEVSQAGKRFVRGGDMLQQLTALRLAGFAVTVRQAYDLAGRLDKRWQAMGLSSRMPQFQLAEKLLECAGAPGNARALCRMVVPDQTAKPAVEHDVMAMLYLAMQALPPQAWAENGGRLKFQEGIVSQLRELQPKPWLSYRGPVVVRQTPSTVEKRDTDRGLPLWS